VTEPADLLATRAAYDTLAVDYEALLRDELAAKPYERAVLGVFAELVRASGDGEVADLGCGPGRVTAHLASLGLDTFGIDLSPAMVEVARSRHPALLFEVGSMAELDLPDGSLAGAVAWYSIIHTPAERRPALFAELARVVRPGGWVLMAFQAGDEVVPIRRAYGHDVRLEAFRLPPGRIVAELDSAGFTEHARLVRRPGDREKTDQAFLVARRTAETAGF
jgi:SAM-dependent methyltransferase